MRRTALALAFATLLAPLAAASATEDRTTAEVVQHHTRVSGTCAVVVRHSITMLQTTMLVVTMAEGSGADEGSATDVRAALLRMMESDRVTAERIEGAFDVVLTEGGRLGMSAVEIEEARAARIAEFDPQVPVALRNAATSGPQFYAQVLAAMRTEVEQCRQWADAARSIFTAL